MSTIIPRLLPATLALAAACASAPPAATVPVRDYEFLLARIIAFEDRRTLQESEGDPAAGAAADDPLSLLADPDPRLRRRAAIAAGRIGVWAASPSIAAVLSDPDPDVRAAAAFALGLVGDPAGIPPLAAALDDPHPAVQARAMDALGLLNATDQADHIAAVTLGYVESGALVGIAADDMTFPLPPPVEVIRSGVLALARMGATAALESLVVAPDGAVRVPWWPAAYALSVAGGPDAAPALRSLLSESGLYMARFAAEGLGRLQDHQAVAPLMDVAASSQAYVWLRQASLAALSRIGDASVGQRVLELALEPELEAALHEPVIRLLGTLRVEDAAGLLLDFLSDERPAVRGAALVALAQIDQALFVQVLSGLDPDRDWRVRAALATALGQLPSRVAAPRVQSMLDDADRRVIPSVLRTLVALTADAAWPTVEAALDGTDPAIRATAATLLGGRAGRDASVRLQEAYRESMGDQSPAARLAILEALAARPDDAAEAALREAMQDPEWPVRRFAVAALTRRGEPRTALEGAIRPAPVEPPPGGYGDPAIVAPAFSPQMYLETEEGRIQIELFVIDAPLTVARVVQLAAAGFYEGLRFQVADDGTGLAVGDPREDGFGGAGGTIRDEISTRRHLRGAVALERPAPDAGDSRFVIFRSPAPARDGRSPVFGRVVEGMDVVDRLATGDVLRDVQVWDGVRMVGGAP